MKQQYTIKSFKSYMREDIIEFLKSVAIDEFGFSEWKQYLENKDFSSYEKGESIFLVAYHGKTIIATCGGLKKNDEIIKLNSFYVNKNYRYQKIGSKLFSRFENFAKQKGFSQIILCTYKQYEKAWHFYSKRGFYLYEKDGHELWCKKYITSKKIFEQDMVLDFLSVDENSDITKSKYSAKSCEFYEQLKNFQKNTLCEKYAIKPIQFTFEITNHCNCNCPHCGMNANSKIQKSRLDKDNLKTIADSLISAGIISFAVTGGEPFLEFDNLCWLIEYTKNKVDIIKLISNGFWGKDAQTYFQKMESCGLLENKYVVPSIQLSIGEQDVDLKYICNIIYYVSKNYTQDELKLGIIYTKNPNSKKSQLEKLYKTYNRIYGEFPSGKIYLTLSEYKNYIKGKAKHLDVFENTVYNEIAFCDNDFSCTLGKFVSPKIFMKTNGDCYPCEIFNLHKNMFIGNLFSDGIQKVLENYNKNKYINFIKKYKTIGFRDVIPKNYLQNLKAETPCMACEACIKFCEKNNLIK